MEFDWSIYKSSALTQEQVMESFEDPFSFRLLPDANRFSTQNRFISLGCSGEGNGVFSVYTSTGKIVRAFMAARYMTEDEALFYKRRAQETM